MEHRAKARVLLLFPAGKRPDFPAIKGAVARIGALSISAESSATPDTQDQSESLWVELLCEGMTFDLCGLASGPSADIPDMRDPSGLLDAAATMEGIELKLGPHLEAGGRTLPIVRSILAVGATLAGTLEGAVAVSWPASGTWLSPKDFALSVDSWLNGGTVPCPAIIDFRTTLDHALQSVGLSLFSGQEVRLETDLAMPDDDLRRLAVRIAGYLIHQGTLDTVDEFSAPDGGLIRLAPSPNGRFVRASRG